MDSSNARWPEDWAPKPNLSHSTVRMLEECPRGWLYKNGNEMLPMTNDERWEVNRQSKLAGDFSIVGTLVDRTIEKGLRRFKAKGSWPKDVKSGTSVLLAEWREFSAGWTHSVKYTSNPWPKSAWWQPLARDYYHSTTPWPEEMVDGILERANTCLDNFVEDGYHEDCFLQRDTSLWQLPNRVPGKPFPWFRAAENIPVYASWDALIVAPTGESLVVDWKCGSPNRSGSTTSAREQLHTYALFVSGQYGVPLSSIKLIAAWLGEDHHADFGPVDETLTASLQDRWVGVFNKLGDDLGNCWRANGDMGVIDQTFPMAAPESTSCKYCRYRACAQCYDSPGFDLDGSDPFDD